MTPKKKKKNKTLKRTVGISEAPGSEVRSIFPPFLMGIALT